MKPRHRVLILHNIIAPYRLPIFEALAQEWDVTVYFCQAKTADRQWQTSLNGYSFRHVVLPHRAIRVGSVASIVINPDLPGRLARQASDVYIAGENSSNAFSVLAVLLTAKLRRKAFVCWSEHIEGERAVATSGAIGRLLIETYRRVVYRNTDSFVAYGSQAADFLVRRGAPSGRIVTGVQVVPGSQTPSVQVSRGEMGFDGKKVVLSVGYLIARKGLDTLIEAFRGMEREDAVLVIAGAGDQEDHLRRLAGGASNIQFPGYVEGTLKAKYYSVADVFVLPTLHDPWGLVVNEAMAYGLPIVVTDRAGCAPDLVGDNGLVVPAGDVHALRQALERLLDGDELRREMGDRSRQIIQRYDVDYARETFAKAVRVALEGRR